MQHLLPWQGEELAHIFQMIPEGEQHVSKPILIVIPKKEASHLSSSFAGRSGSAAEQGSLCHFGRGRSFLAQGFLPCPLTKDQSRYVKSQCETNCQSEGSKRLIKDLF